MAGLFRANIFNSSSVLAAKTSSSSALIAIGLDNKDVATVKDLMQQGIVEGNSTCESISSSVIELEIKIGCFSFSSLAGDSKLYNLMFLFSLDDQIVLGSFNCMHYDMDGWLEITGQMLRSIRVVQGMTSQ